MALQKLRLFLIFFFLSHAGADLFNFKWPSANNGVNNINSGQTATNPFSFWTKPGQTPLTPFGNIFNSNKNTDTSSNDTPVDQDTSSPGLNIPNSIDHGASPDNADSQPAQGTNPFNSFQNLFNSFGQNTDINGWKPNDKQSFNPLGSVPNTFNSFVPPKNTNSFSTFGANSQSGINPLGGFQNTFNPFGQNKNDKSPSNSNSASQQPQTVNPFSGFQNMFKPVGVQANNDGVSPNIGSTQPQQGYNPLAGFQNFFNPSGQNNNDKGSNTVNPELQQPQGFNPFSGLQNTFKPTSQNKNANLNGVSTQSQGLNPLGDFQNLFNPSGQNNNDKGFNIANPESQQPQGFNPFSGLENMFKPTGQQTISDDRNSNGVSTQSQGLNPFGDFQNFFNLSGQNNSDNPESQQPQGFNPFNGLGSMFKPTGQQANNDDGNSNGGSTQSQGLNPFGDFQNFFNPSGQNNSDNPESQQPQGFNPFNGLGNMFKPTGQQANNNDGNSNGVSTQSQGLNPLGDFQNLFNPLGQNNNNKGSKSTSTESQQPQGFSPFSGVDNLFNPFGPKANLTASNDESQFQENTNSSGGLQNVNPLISNNVSSDQNNLDSNIFGHGNKNPWNPFSLFGENNEPSSILGFNSTDPKIWNSSNPNYETSTSESSPFGYTSTNSNVSANNIDSNVNDLINNKYPNPPTDQSTVNSVDADNNDTTSDNMFNLWNPTKGYSLFDPTSWWNSSFANPFGSTIPNSLSDFFSPLLGSSSDNIPQTMSTPVSQTGDSANVTNKHPDNSTSYSQIPTQIFNVGGQPGSPIYQPPSINSSYIPYTQLSGDNELSSSSTPSNNAVNQNYLPTSYQPTNNSSNPLFSSSFLPYTFNPFPQNGTNVESTLQQPLPDNPSNISESGNASQANSTNNTGNIFQQILSPFMSTFENTSNPLSSLADIFKNIFNPQNLNNTTNDQTSTSDVSNFDNNFSSEMSSTEATDANSRPTQASSDESNFNNNYPLEIPSTEATNTYPVYSVPTYGQYQYNNSQSLYPTLSNSTYSTQQNLPNYSTTNSIPWLNPVYNTQQNTASATSESPSVSTGYPISSLPKPYPEFNSQQNAASATSETPFESQTNSMPSSNISYSTQQNVTSTSKSPTGSTESTPSSAPWPSFSNIFNMFSKPTFGLPFGNMFPNIFKTSGTGTGNTSSSSQQSGNIFSNQPSGSNTSSTSPVFGNIFPNIPTIPGFLHSFSGNGNQSNWSSPPATTGSTNGLSDMLNNVFQGIVPLLKVIANSIPEFSSNGTNLPDQLASYPELSNPLFGVMNVSFDNNSDASDALLKGLNKFDTAFPNLLSNDSDILNRLPSSFNQIIPNKTNYANVYVAPVTPETNSFRIKKFSDTNTDAVIPSYIREMMENGPAALPFVRLPPNFADISGNSSTNNVYVNGSSLSAPDVDSMVEDLYQGKMPDDYSTLFYGNVSNSTDLHHVVFLNGSTLLPIDKSTDASNKQSNEAVVPDQLDQMYGEVIFASVYFAHGESTPITTYPLDPFNQNTWPGGLGHLLTAGRWQMYHLGMSLQDRYKNLISTNMSDIQIRIDSIETSLNLESAECLSAGIVATPGVPSVLQQTIPIYGIPPSTDNLIGMNASCPRYVLEVEKFAQTSDWTSYYNKYESNLDYIGSSTGYNMKENPSFTMRYLYNLYNELTFEKQNGLLLPNWTSTVFPDTMKDMLQDYFKFFVYSPTMKKLKTGPILSNISNDMQEKHASSLKLHLYSGNENGIGAIMTTLGVYNSTIPPTGSALLFELRRLNDTFYVVVLYQNSSASSPVILNVSNCSSVCRLEKFSNFVSQYTTSNWEGDCDIDIIDIVTETVSLPIIILGLVILIVIVFVLLLLLIKCCRHMKKRSRKFTFR